MSRVLWQLGYAYRAVRSRYEFTLLEAWSEACASWEMNNGERMNDPMPTPAEALYQDQYEWGEL